MPSALSHLPSPAGLRPGLRLPLHRGTTAHLSSLYPFSVQRSFGFKGPYIGFDVLAGAAEFCWDPFEAYRAGLVTNPNCWVFGEPGNGKSALVKSLLWRMAAVYGCGEERRWIAIADPKGEYLALARRLGLTVVRLAPGGGVRVNPLAPGSDHPDDPLEERVLRRAGMVATLIATVLARPLNQLEDAAVFAAVEALLTAPGGSEPTLADLAGLLSSPPDLFAERLRRSPTDLQGDLASAAFAVDKLLTRSLRGMFDGRSTVAIDWDGPGIVLDLSAVPSDSEALPLVMVAAAGWLSHAMAGPGPLRIQVLDEAWALLGNRHTASYLQSAFKLGRSQGVANLCVAHRPSDLAAQSDDGTATAKIASGLLADAATKIVLRQAPDQLSQAAALLGLNDGEARVVGQLARGRHLWKIGFRTAVIQHHLSRAEEELCDTDSRMRAAA